MSCAAPSCKRRSATPSGASTPRLHCWPANRPQSGRRRRLRRSEIERALRDPALGAIRYGGLRIGRGRATHHLYLRCAIGDLHDFDSASDIEAPKLRIAQESARDQRISLAAGERHGQIGDSRPSCSNCRGWSYCDGDRCRRARCRDRRGTCGDGADICRGRTCDERAHCQRKSRSDEGSTDHSAHPALKASRMDAHSVEERLR